MNYLVKLISSLVKEGARVLKFERFPGDVQTCEEAMPAGVDFPPIKGQTAIQLETSANGDDVIGGYVNTSQEALPGERRIYAVDESGNIVGYFWIKGTGIAEVMGNADNAVRFTPTAACINEMKDDINQLKQLISGWGPIANDGGAALKAALSSWFGTPLTEDIAGAKIDEIKTP